MQIDERWLNCASADEMSEALRARIRLLPSPIREQALLILDKLDEEREYERGLACERATRD